MQQARNRYGLRCMLCHVLGGSACAVSEVWAAHPRSGTAVQPVSVSLAVSSRQSARSGWGRNGFLVRPVLTNCLCRDAKDMGRERSSPVHGLHHNACIAAVFMPHVHRRCRSVLWRWPGDAQPQRLWRQLKPDVNGDMSWIVEGLDIDVVSPCTLRAIG